MLIDTSGLLCLLDVRERHHTASTGFYDAAVERLTHDYVLAEFITLATARGVPRERGLGFAHSLLATPQVEIVWVDESLHQEALVFLRARLDKTWSLCDAVSFLLMQQRGIMHALTTDAHFEQAGFVRLLKP